MNAPAGGVRGPAFTLGRVPPVDEAHGHHNTVIRKGPDGEMQVVREDIAPLRDDLKQIIEENK